MTQLNGLFQGAVFVKLYAPRISYLSSFVGVFLAVLFLGACQESSHESRPSGSVTVKIPVMSGNTYHLGLVELTTLEDMVTLKGEAAEFLYSPSLRDNHLSGAAPRIRTLRTKDGVYVGQDFLSIQLLSLYASFEGLMKFDEKLGVKELNTWPRTVAVNTHVVDKMGKASRDNARYSGKIDAFLFEPYSRNQLPLMVNAGVVGHEHFHSLFYKLVLQPLGGSFSEALSSDPHDSEEMAEALGLGKTTQKVVDSGTSDVTLYHLMLLRGMNEGLADLWGWIYTGDTEFVSRSITSEKNRNLTLDSGVLSDFSAREAGSMDAAYTLGSQYAKMFHAVVQQEATASQKTEESLRFELAKAILKALPRLKTSIQSLKQNERLNSSVLVSLISNEISFLSDDGCKLLKSRVTAENQNQICAGRAPAKP